MSAKLPVSVAIIANNEADRIEMTLKSVSHFASQIVVIDSGSTDGTQDLCRSYGAEVYEESWKGFAGQKNSLTDKCSCEWILYLDADEVITEKLHREIETAITRNDVAGFSINRKTFYLGRLLEHAWQKNYRLRLVKKSANPLWRGEIVHEELVIDGICENLKEHLVHYSYRDIRDHFIRTIKYARLSAYSYKKRGRRPSLVKLLVNPIFSFIKLYIIKFGFLDGIAGLVAGVSAYIYTFLKYAFLYEFYLADTKKISAVEDCPEGVAGAKSTEKTEP